MEQSNSDMQRNIFAQIFRLSNALQVYLDHQLKEDGLTSKQMFFDDCHRQFQGSQPHVQGGG